MNLAHWHLRAAATSGERPALMQGEAVVVDDAAFRDRAAALAAALIAAGVRPGDGVALYMADCPEFLVAFWAPGSPGRRSWPSTTSFTRQEAASILGNSGAARVFVTPDLAPGLRAVTDVPMTDVTSAAFAAMTRGPGAAVAHREEGDLAWLFHTSGTTGRPKA